MHIQIVNMLVDEEHNIKKYPKNKSNIKRTSV